MSFFPLRIHQNRCRLGLCNRPHGGSLQRSLDPLAGFKGAASRQEGNGGEGREGLGEGKGGKRGDRGNGQGRGKGKLGNGALVVGG